MIASFGPNVTGSGSKGPGSFGQRRLVIRMDAAARAVCGDGLTKVHLSLAASARECRAEVLANIRDQIETPDGGQWRTGGAGL